MNYFLKNKFATVMELGVSNVVEVSQISNVLNSIEEDVDKVLQLKETPTPDLN